MPQDIEKLMKERPEMFDFADIPENLNVDPKYQAAMDRAATLTYISPVILQEMLGNFKWADQPNAASLSNTSLCSDQM